MPYYERVCIGQDFNGNDIYQQVEVESWSEKVGLDENNYLENDDE